MTPTRHQKEVPMIDHTPHPSRRGLLRTAAASGAVTVGLGGEAYAGASRADQRLKVKVPRSGTHVVLLGTGGGPAPFPGRAGICTAVVVDGFTYLVDFGHGAFDQFGKTDLDIERVPAAFVTHLHSDHLADAWTFPWLRFGGVDPLAMRLDVYGPGPAGRPPRNETGHPVRVINPRNPTPGIEDFYAGMVKACAYDLNIRLRDEAWPDIATKLQAHDVLPPASVGASPSRVAPRMEPFEVMRDERVRVSATLVEHAPVYPSFAFRFDTADGSVTISGDTAPSDNLVRLAGGTDLLIHEVIDVDVLALEPDMTEQQLAHLKEAHTDVTLVGRIATRSGARQLVLSHLVPSAKALPDSRWKARARRGYGGRVHVGNDLDVLRVGRLSGDTAVPS
jgi:ribonuclease BN (tRNA processing enzyme)